MLLRTEAITVHPPLSCNQILKLTPNTELDKFHAQAFKNYDEAGVVRRVQCLKYLVLASMLMQSSVDPFDAQACP